MLYHDYNLNVSVTKSGKQLGSRTFAPAFLGQGFGFYVTVSGEPRRPRQKAFFFPIFHDLRCGHAFCFKIRGPESEKVAFHAVTR